MRRLISLAIASLFFVLIWGIVQQPTRSQLSARQQSQQILNMHQNDTPIASPIVADAIDVSVSTASVSYGTLAGQPLTGYLATPADMSEPVPALIVIHEWWGLNDNIQAMTRRLASEGYAALAVDLYGGEVAESPDVARGLVQAALENPERLKENLSQAYRYLETALNAPKVGTIGWCFGGSWSLNTALLLPDQIDATVIYYGGQLVTDPDALSALNMPIQGHFGALDTNPPVETVQQFEAALNSVGKSPEIFIYEDANHAFANPSGTRYNAEAAELSWERTIAFFNEHLKN